jgi:hypothetical protein
MQWELTIVVGYVTVSNDISRNKSLEADTTTPGQTSW